MYKTSTAQYAPDEIAAAMALAYDPRTAAATDMLRALKGAQRLLCAMSVNIENSDYLAILAAIAQAENRS